MKTANDVSKVFDLLSLNYENIFTEGKDKYPYNLYRYKIVERFIKNNNFQQILDVGCGTGYVVRDLYKQKYNIKGCDLSDKMVSLAKASCVEEKINPDIIFKENAVTLQSVPDKSLNLLTYLGIHMYLTKKEEQQSYVSCYKKLKKNGFAIFGYLNQLFDLYTLNRHTIDFFMADLLNYRGLSQSDKEKLRSELSGLLNHFDKPELENDNAGFSKLKRIKHNPLTIKEELRVFGFNVTEIHFFQFFSFPPLIKGKFTDKFNKIGKSFEVKKSSHWKGNFLAHQFLTIAKKF